MGRKRIDVEVTDFDHCTFTYSDAHATSHRRNKDKFQWISNSGDIKIDFPDGHPFDTDPPYYAGEGVYTQAVTVVNRMASEGDWKYTVTVTSDEGQSCQDDPSVIIDNTEMFDGDRDRDDDRAETLKLTSEESERVLHQLFDKLSKTAQAADAIKLFPDGIDYVSLDVEVTPVKVSLTVSGPKSSGG